MIIKPRVLIFLLPAFLLPTLLQVYSRSVFSEETKIKHIENIELKSLRRCQPLDIVVFKKRIYLTNPAGASRRRGVLIYDYITEDISAIRRTKFSWPSRLAINPLDNGGVYVVDSQQSCVKVFDLKGNFLFKFGSPGSGRGEFRQPQGITINPRRKWIYIADLGNSRVQVFDLEGNYLFEFGGFFRPQSITVDNEGKVYVVEPLTCAIKIYDATGTKLVRKFGDTLLFSRPEGIAVDSQMNIYVVDTVQNNIQVFNSRGIPLYLLGKSGNANGEFNSPNGIFIDDKDKVYIADTNNQRVQIFEIVK